ncbi:glycosyltransferase [Candidatus Woesearchaeota archaeon]|nr:glycosyltransferase [Candidatus Woesearchaeota archaeon]
MTSDKPTLGLCMIVKDEEKFLGQCLNSVKDLVDEIIIVDTGSTDNTINIAKKFTDNIHKFRWCDDFSKARNESLKYATKDWILVLDADEVISKEDIEKIKQLINKEDVDAYQLIQRNYSKSNKGINCEEDKYPESKPYKSYIPSTLIRLFRNKGYKFQNKVHELIEDSIKGKILNSNIPIHHMKDESKDRIEFYIKLGKQQIESTPDNPKPYYELGKLYMSKDDYNTALNYFRKSIDLLGPRKGLVINKVLFLDAGIACFKSHNYAEAKQYLDKAIENDSKNSWPYFYKALILHEEGAVREAAEMYLKAINNKTRDPVAYGNLGEILLKSKDYKGASLLLTKAQKLDHPMKDRLKIITDRIEKAIKK